MVLSVNYSSDPLQQQLATTLELSLSQKQQDRADQHYLKTRDLIYVQELTAIKGSDYWRRLQAIQDEDSRQKVVGGLKVDELFPLGDLLTQKDSDLAQVPASSPAVVHDSAPTAPSLYSEASLDSPSSQCDDDSLSLDDLANDSPLRQFEYELHKLSNILDECPPENVDGLEQIFDETDQIFCELKGLKVSPKSLHFKQDLEVAAVHLLQKVELKAYH